MDRAFPLLPVVNWGDMAKPDGDFLLPVGTVTMLLADVEGSTRRWQTDEAAMAEAMASLSERVGELVGRHHGVRPLEQGEGDSFVAAFARASEAVACAVEITMTSELPLRIGVHAGEAQRTDDGTYVGPTLNRTARLRDAAHGGQIVLSQTAADLVGERLPEGCALRDLGSHRLRDLSRAERIFQLDHPDLRTDFPPLRTLDTYRHNLPAYRTAFFGREQEMAEVRDLLATASLVTLTGPGGCGKTRLAVQTAADLVDAYPDGVFFADLASVTDPGDVPKVVSRAIGLTEEARGDIAPFLRGKHTLVVLDNCEHVVGACADLCDRLLSGAPTARVLATSREPLRIEGETTYVLPPLPIPEEGVTGVDGLAPFAATNLFLDRARRARADFEVGADAEVIAAICRRLDGVPLAIELAAARVRVLTPRQILDGLDERFALLTGGARTAMPRQQTLTASVDWSYELLTDLERAVLRRLAVFAASFDLAAASAVASGSDVEAHQVLDLVSLLVDKSLVQADTDGASARYRMLETVRQYALARLDDAGERDPTLARHRDHYLALAEDIRNRLWSDDGIAAYQRFQRERTNLEAAFRLSVARADADEAARFVASLSWLVSRESWAGESIAWFDAVRPMLADVSEPHLADVLSWSVRQFGEPPPDDVRDLARASVAFHRASGDTLRLGRALAVASICDADAAGIVEAASLLDAAGDRVMAVAPLRWAPGLDRDAIRAHAAHAATIARRLTGPIAKVAVRSAITQPGLQAPSELLALARALSPNLDALPDLDLHTQTYLPGLLFGTGRHGEARAAAEALLESRLRVGDRFCASHLMTTLGVVAWAEGDHDDAIAFIERSADVPGGSAVVAGLIELTRGAVDAARSRIDRESSRAAAGFGPGAIANLPEAALRHVTGGHDVARELAYSVLAEPSLTWFQLVLALELVASIEASLGDGVAASRTLGALTAYRRMVGFRFSIANLPSLPPIAERAVAAIGQDAYDSAHNEGLGLDLEEVRELLLRGRGARRRPSSGWDSLTPTERQVVELVGRGLSNREVADQLIMSIRTVTTHLGHVYAKLGYTTRPELVAAVAARGTE